MATIPHASRRWSVRRVAGFLVAALCAASAAKATESDSEGGSTATAAPIALHSRALLLETRSPARAEALLQALSEVARHPELDAHARDALLFDYLQGLRELPRRQVPEAVLDWLASYPVQSWRRHEESATAMEPEFAINAGAEGLKQQWRFQDGQETLRSALSGDPTPVLKRYLKLSPGDPLRTGMESMPERLAEPALRRLAAAIDAGPPVLSGSLLNGMVRLRLGDLDGLARLLSLADPIVIAGVLRPADAHLPPAAALQFARMALAHPDPGTQGLALAVAGRVLAGRPGPHPDWSSELVALLSDPDLGAAAALQLARTLDGEQVEALAERLRDEPRAAARIALIRRLRDDVSISPRAVRP